MQAEEALARIARLEQELRALRASVAGPARPREEIPERLPLLVVTAGEARVAVPLGAVVEVVPRVLLDRLPDAPPHRAGFMRWRGEHVGVLDLQARWTGQPLPARLEDRIVVLRHGEALHGLLVEEIAGLDEVRRSEATPLPPGSEGADYAVALFARGDGSVVLVSLEELFRPGEAGGGAPPGA